MPDLSKDKIYEICQELLTHLDELLTSERFDITAGLSEALYEFEDMIETLYEELQ